MVDLKINAQHLDQIEHLLEQSMNGIHLLFDNHSIAKVLKTPTEEAELFQFKNLEKIRTLFTEFVGNKTLQGKRDYLAALSNEDYELLLRTYFHIVENSLFATDSTRH